MAGTWSLYISSIGVPTSLKNTVVLKTWRGNSQEVNTIRILLAPSLSGGEYSRRLICIRGRTSNAEPPYTAIMSILLITLAGVSFCILIIRFFCICVFCKFVFSYFCILFLSRCIQPLCPFFTAHYLPGLYHHSFVMPSYIIGFNFSLHISLWSNIERMASGWTNIPYSYFHTLLYTVILLSDAILKEWLVAGQI